MELQQVLVVSAGHLYAAGAALAGKGGSGGKGGGGSHGTGGSGGAPAPAWLVIPFIVLVAAGILAMYIVKRRRAD